MFPSSSDILKCFLTVVDKSDFCRLRPRRVHISFTKMPVTRSSTVANTPNTVASKVALKVDTPVAFETVDPVEDTPQYHYAILDPDREHPQRMVRDTKMTLKELQKIVGGRIELLRIPPQLSDDNEFWLVVNEDPRSLPYEDQVLNVHVFGTYYKEICGPAIVASENCFES